MFLVLRGAEQEMWITEHHVVRVQEQHLLITEVSMTPSSMTMGERRANLQQAPRENWTG